MSRADTALAWIGKLAGIVALIGLGMTVVVVGAFYVVDYETYDLPSVGTPILIAPAVVTVAGTIVWVLVTLGRRRTSVDTQEASPASSPSQTSDDVDGTGTGAGDYLREFNRANKYLALVFAVLFGLTALSSEISAAAVGTPLATVVGFLLFATEMLGGSTIHLVNLVWFGSAWYGIREFAATEAWVVGMTGWVLFTLSGLSMLSTSLGAIAIVVAGLKILGTGYRARGATEQYVIDDVLDDIQQRLAAPPESSATPKGKPEDNGTGAGPVAELTDTVRSEEIESLGDVWAILDVDPEFVHPREAADPRLTYWSYLGYGLGGLTILAALLIGIEVWGFPSLGLWGLPVGLIYLGHAFALPQRSAFVHVAGVAWYGFGLILAVFTLSPLAFLGNVAGIYFGWAAMAGVKQPDEVVAELQALAGDEAGADGAISVAGLVGSGLLGGIVIGGVLGLVGAVVFAWFSVQTKTVYGILVLLPALAAGIGVSLGVGDDGGRVSGLLAAGLSILTIGMGFRLITWWMPPVYELEPDVLLAVVPLVGVYLAYKLGESTSVSSATDESAEAGA